MEKYTKEQKLEVAKFFEEGFSAREIFEVTNIPVGTLYRWKHEAKASDPKAQEVEDNLDPKVQQVVTNTKPDELLQLKSRVSELEEELADMKEQLTEALKWINAKKKREAKECENTSTFQFKRAGPM